MRRSDPLKESPSQTAGPYVHIGCAPNFCGIPGVYASDVGAEVLTPAARGARITVQGVVYDGAGAPVKDALIEIWQADADGRYPGAHDPRGGADPGFTGFARRPADQSSGLWRVETVKPGAVPHASGAMMAPHLTLWIVARGINIGLYTRMYFPEDAAAHETDPVLSRIEHRDRLQTLIATADGAGGYQFDIHLQGPRETVFFDI